MDLQSAIHRRHGKLGSTTRWYCCVHCVIWDTLDAVSVGDRDQTTREAKERRKNCGHIPGVDWGNKGDVWGPPCDPANSKELQGLFSCLLCIRVHADVVYTEACKIKKKVPGHHHASCSTMIVVLYSGIWRKKVGAYMASLVPRLPIASFPGSRAWAAWEQG